MFGVRSAAQILANWSACRAVHECTGINGRLLGDLTTGLIATLGRLPSLRRRATVRQRHVAARCYRSQGGESRDISGTNVSMGRLTFPNLRPRVPAH